LGYFDFNGLDDADNVTLYAWVEGNSSYVVNGDEAGELSFHVKMDGTNRELLTIDGHSTGVNQGEVTVNEDGQNVDFRVEAQGKQYTFCINGGNGNIGIGREMTTATAKLHIMAGTATAGTAPLKLTTGTLLGTPEVGAIEFLDGKFYITCVEEQRVIDRTSDVAVSTVTVADTDVETTIWTGAMAADSLKAGNLFKFHCDGIVANGGPTAGDQITIRIKVGGVTKATLAPVTKTLAAGTMWMIDANATQRTIGAAGSRAIHVHLQIGNPITTGDEVTVIGVSNIDTTANMDVTVTVEWASADAANTISLYQGFMEYKN